MYSEYVSKLRKSRTAMLKLSIYFHIELSHTVCTCIVSMLLLVTQRKLIESFYICNLLWSLNEIFLLYILYISQINMSHANKLRSTYVKVMQVLELQWDHWSTTMKYIIFCHFFYKENHIRDISFVKKPKKGPWAIIFMNGSINFKIQT